MADILDGEVAVAELLEGDIEEEIELVDITRVVPPGKLVGAHVSMSNGIARAVINAASIGMSCFPALSWACYTCALAGHSTQVYLLGPSSQKNDRSSSAVDTAFLLSRTKSPLAVDKACHLCRSKSLCTGHTI